MNFLKIMGKIEEIFNHSAENGAEGSLGIDSKNRLYWNNRLIVTEKKFKFDKLVNVSIVLSAISTLVMAINSTVNIPIFIYVYINYLFRNKFN